MVAQTVIRKFEATAAAPATPETYRATNGELIPPQAAATWKPEQGELQVMSSSPQSQVLTHPDES